MRRKSAEVTVTVHGPDTEEAACELAKLVAGVHADAAGRYIQKLSCGSEQKLRLLSELIKAAKKVDKKSSENVP